MARLALGADPDLEYEVFLSRKLGMTVRELRVRMTRAEFLLQSRYDIMQNQRREVGL